MHWSHGKGFRSVLGWRNGLKGAKMDLNEIATSEDQISPITNERQH